MMARGQSRTPKELRVFPSPYTSNYHPDHKMDSGRPPGFWDYWNRVYDDPELRDRVVVYVYRLWPVMRDGHRQVAKAYAPFPYEDLLKMYGCGDYLLKLNDAAGRKGQRRNITNCKVAKLGDYNLSEHPPYLDLDGLDVNNPHNERYLVWCESRGIKIPGKDSKEEEVSNKVTEVLLDKYVQLTDKLAKEPVKRVRTGSFKAPSSVVAPMVEVIKTATEGANQIMQKAYERTSELHNRSQDPAELLAKTASVIKELIPQRDPAENMVTSYLSAMRAMQEQLAQMNQNYVDRMVTMTAERVAHTEKQMAALLEAISRQQQQQQQASSQPAQPQPQSLRDVLKEMAEFKEQMREVLGLEDDDGRKQPGWVEHLPLILQGVNTLGAIIASAMHNYAVAKTGQGHWLFETEGIVASFPEVVG